MADMTKLLCRAYDLQSINHSESDHFENDRYVRVV